MRKLLSKKEKKVSDQTDRPTQRDIDRRVDGNRAINLNTDPKQPVRSGPVP